MMEHKPIAGVTPEQEKVANRMLEGTELENVDLALGWKKDIKDTFGADAITHFPSGIGDEEAQKAAEWLEKKGSPETKGLELM